MAFIRQHINFLFVFILPVYLYIVQNSIRNEHTHVYANGIVVKHSHPLNNGSDVPVSEHDHSKQEICLYSSLHLDFYVSPESVHINETNTETQFQYFIANEKQEFIAFLENSIPRAPPV